MCCADRNSRYLILAQETSVQVYNTSTSLLYRSLSVHESARITDVALSPCQPKNLYGLTLDGLLYMWDWESGELKKSWTTGSELFGMTVCSTQQTEESEDLLFLCGRKGDQSILLIRSVNVDYQLSKLRTIFRSAQPISQVKVTNRGRVVIVAAGDGLVVGHATSSVSEGSAQLSYVWREVNLPSRITCLELREPFETRQVKRKATSHAVNAVDVAVGVQDGSIYVHEDLLNKLIFNEKRAASGEIVDVTPRRLHWHRDPVNTVKWSKDGK